MGHTQGLLSPGATDTSLCASDNTGTAAGAGGTLQLRDSWQGVPTLPPKHLNSSGPSAGSCAKFFNIVGIYLG